MSSTAQSDEEEAAERGAPRRLSARERRKMRQNPAQYPRAPEPPSREAHNPPPPAAPPERDGWKSIGSIVAQNPPTLEAALPEDSMPIIEASATRPTAEDQPKPPNTAALLRRLLAADLVLDKPIRKLDLGVCV